MPKIKITAEAQRAMSKIQIPRAEKTGVRSQESALRSVELVKLVGLVEFVGQIKGKTNLPNRTN